MGQAQAGPGPGAINPRSENLLLMGTPAPKRERLKIEWIKTHVAVPS